MTDADKAYNERRKIDYASPAFAPTVDRGRRKTPQISPERVRELMDEQEKLVEARHAEEKPTREWIDLKPKKTPIPSERRLRTYNRDQQRTLEVRLYHGRKIHKKPDFQISEELDLSPDDFEELAGMSGML